MKRNILVFIFLILLASSFKYRSRTQASILNADNRVIIEQVSDRPADNKVAERNLKNEISNLENLERKAILDSDTATLYSLWSSDLVINTENKIHTLPEVKESFSKRGVKPAPFDRVIEKITITGHVAIVMGHENQVPDHKSAKTMGGRFTDMWLKDGNNWKLTVRQSANLPVMH